MAELLAWPAPWLAELLARCRLELSPRAGFTSHQPGWLQPNTPFTDYDIHYLLTGRMEYRSNGQVLRAQAGDFVLHGPGPSFVEYCAPRGSGVRLLLAHFDLHPAAGLNPLVALELPLKARLGAGQADHPHATPADRLVADLLDALIARKKGHPWAKARAPGLTLALLSVGLEQALRQKRVRFEPLRLGPEWLWSVLQDLDRRLADPELDVAELAREAGLSPSHFAHEFKRLTGQAPKRFLLRKRMRKAADLLAWQDSLNITEVGRKCGFPDPYHFSARFKREMGLSPRAWRERHRLGAD